MTTRRRVQGAVLHLVTVAGVVWGCSPARQESIDLYSHFARAGIPLDSCLNAPPLGPDSTVALAIAGSELWAVLPSGTKALRISPDRGPSWITPDTLFVVASVSPDSAGRLLSVTAELEEAKANRRITTLCIGASAAGSFLGSVGRTQHQSSSVGYAQWFNSNGTSVSVVITAPAGYDPVRIWRLLYSVTRFRPRNRDAGDY